MRDPDHFIAPFVELASAQAVKFSSEDQVLIYRQLVVERKFLRHVADDVFDRFGVAHHIVSIDPRAAVARLQNSTKHANDSGLAGTIRTEKSEDRSFFDFKRNMIDGGERAEAFRQTFALDHCFHCRSW